MRRLSALIHGNSGVGKTPVANTTPGPRVMIDCEGGAMWLPNHVVKWNPRTTNPNDLPGLTEDTTVVVRVTSDYQILDLVYQYLTMGPHPFKSLIIDSLTELQENAKKTITTGTFEQQHWGTLLERMQAIIMQFKDLADEESPFPLECVIFTAGSVLSDKTNKKTAYVQGQLQTKLPYKVSVVGYLERDLQDLPHLVISPIGEIDAKDRTTILKAHYGTTITGPTIDLRQIMAVLNPEINEEPIAS